MSAIRRYLKSCRILAKVIGYRNVLRRFNSLKLVFLEGRICAIPGVSALISQRGDSHEKQGRTVVLANNFRKILTLPHGRINGTNTKINHSITIHFYSVNKNQTIQYNSHEENPKIFQCQLLRIIWGFLFHSTNSFLVIYLTFCVYDKFMHSLLEEKNKFQSNVDNKMQRK